MFDTSAEGAKVPSVFSELEAEKPERNVQLTNAKGGEK